MGTTDASNELVERWRAHAQRRRVDTDTEDEATYSMARTGAKPRERNSGRARHALRATFITLAEEDGAPRLDRPRDVAEPTWAALCAEVAKLRVTPRAPAGVVTPGASGGAEAEA